MSADWLVAVPRRLAACWRGSALARPAAERVLVGAGGSAGVAQLGVRLLARRREVAAAVCCL